MGFYKQEFLESLGFKSLGKNVLVSDKASIYNHGEIEIGDNSRIDDFCVLSGKVVIGSNVHIAVFSNVAGGEAGIVFEDFSGLAYGCQIFAQSDDYSGGSMTNPTVPDEFKRELKASVLIGRHCIVGTYSVVLPGVNLAEGTAVGAMSMVTKNTEPWSIYFGVPAKKVKDRKKDLLMLELDYLSKKLLPGHF
jgi:galactoside O-acetyltransferase